MTPDDHVNIGFHEVLLHDMEDEDLPFVTLSELGCLHQIWPKICLCSCPDTSMIWNGCGRNVGSASVPRSRGNCPHCGKYIQQNLGKHVALYHIELAQLWRCPVAWCTVWKGTAQDCVDHM